MKNDPIDDGRQFERTELAHWRTALAAFVAALLIVRQSDEGAERLVAVVGALAGLLTIVGFGFVRQAALQREDPTVQPLAIAGVAAALVVMEVVAVIVVI